jgi:hypothetical protein
MRAFEVLQEVHRSNMFQGSTYLDAPKTYGLQLVVLKGKLKRRHWYFCTFRKSMFRSEPDVVLILGEDGEKQYLFEVER